MQSVAISRALSKWPEVSELIFVPHTQAEYDRLVSLLDELTDEVGQDETHPLASLMELVGVLIERYEDENIPELNEA